MISTFSKKADEIKALVDKHPEDLAQHLADTHKPIYEASPELGQGLQGVAIRGLSFLNQKLPKPNTELPGDRQYEPSIAQKSQWLRYHESVNDPLSALEHIRKGTLSNEHMEALNAVHPNLLKEMQNEMVAQMEPDKVRALPMAVKASVSKFMGSPVTSGLMPQVVQADQANFAIMGAMKQAEQAGQGKTTLGGLSKLDGSKRAATETQSLEEESD